MPGYPLGTVTFLSCDIVGAAIPQGGPEGALVERSVERHGGAVISPGAAGGSHLATFARATDAVAAAAALQGALRATPGPDAPSRGLRLAVHTGEADRHAGGYAGRAVDRCARLRAAAHGGQTLLSRATQELVRDHLPPGAALRDLGERRLTDLVRPEHLFQLDAPGLPADFPPPRTLEAFPTNLPLQPTPFVGRAREVAAVRQRLLDPAVQLVTLTGAGGMGKTRLGLQVAAGALEDFADGVFFVPLAALRDPALVPPAIAQALGVGEAGGQPLAATLDGHLRGKRLLLLLDNFEQLLAAAAPLARLLAAHPGLKALVTSRAPLRLRGERAVAVGPLVAPDPGRPPALAALAHYDAVRLFIERARDVDAAFAVTDENAPAIAAICQRLDGLPLAIELAVARLRLLSPAGLLARLEHRLRLLTGGARDLPARHQTLRATLDWSHDLLAPGERRLFARLAIFAGGATLEDAEAVCNSDRALGPDVLDAATALADQSLLRRETGAGDEPRLGMLALIREYALERLEAAGEAEALRRRHAARYLALAERAERELEGAAQAAWLDRLELEHDNLRAALGWALGAGETETALRLAGALWRFWYVRGHLSEGRRWLEATLAAAAPGPAERRGTVLAAAGALAHNQGDYPAARAHHEANLALQRERGNREGIAGALNNLAMVPLYQGDYAAAQALLEASLALYRAVGDRRGSAYTLNGLGAVARRRGDHAAAQARHEEGLALFRELGDRQGSANALHDLGAVARLRGDTPAARARQEESLALFRRLGDRRGAANALHELGLLARLGGDYPASRARHAESLALRRAVGDREGVAEGLEGLAALAAAWGQAARAARLWGAAAALREAIAAPPMPAARAEHARLVAAARARLGGAAWDAAWAAGRGLSPDEAAEEALAVVETAAPAPPARAAGREDGLTKQELAVLRLLAAGRTNAAIAGELFVDETTVERHITNLYRKIRDATGVEKVNRVAAADYARQHGLGPERP